MIKLQFYYLIQKGVDIMNKNLKTLLSAGVISLAMIGGKTIQSNALSYGYTSANLNLRQYASTTSKKITTIPKNSQITIYKSYGNWYSVQYNGKWGYVSKDYVGNNTNNNTNKATNCITFGIIIPFNFFTVSVLLSRYFTAC